MEKVIKVIKIGDKYEVCLGILNTEDDFVDHLIPMQQGIESKEKAYVIGCTLQAALIGFGIFRII